MIWDGLIINFGNVYLFLRERECKGEKQRERETEDPKQDQ